MGVSPKKTTVKILIAEDDVDDQLLLRQAIDSSHVQTELTCVENGEELIGYLTRKGKFADKKTSPRPDLILLDLNMPKVDGREALKVIKQNPDLRHIPVIVFTTSQSEDDIDTSYMLGVNSYITKPMNFDELTHLIKDLDAYWFKTVSLPKED